MPAKHSAKTPRFVTRRSGIHGKGVFATTAIPWDTRLMEYKGEIITPEESIRRYPDTHTFIFMLDENRYVDGGSKGNSSRWVNHSCDPNCEVEYEGDHIYFDTRRHINRGEEITIDYNFEVLGTRRTAALLREYACKCGSPRCRGTYLSPRESVADDPLALNINERSPPAMLSLRGRYWDAMAPVYDQEIFDVLRNDRQRVLLKALDRVAPSARSIIDFGCAVGKWLPHLSPRFGTVHAIDISGKCLDIARERCAEFTNIRYLKSDLANRKARLPKADAGLCVHAVLSASRRHQEAFFANMARAIRKKGSLILCVPSLESALLAAQLQVRWKLDAGTGRERVGPTRALRKWNHLMQGHFEVGGLPYKLFLREELEMQLPGAGFSVVQIEKVEYDWFTEFADPPDWLKQPRPWSWVVVARRR